MYSAGFSDRAISQAAIGRAGRGDSAIGQIAIDGGIERSPNHLAGREYGHGASRAPQVVDGGLAFGLNLGLGMLDERFRLLSGLRHEFLAVRFGLFLRRGDHGLRLGTRLAELLLHRSLRLLSVALALDGGAQPRFDAFGALPKDLRQWLIEDAVQNGQKDQEEENLYEKREVEVYDHGISPTRRPLVAAGAMRLIGRMRLTCPASRTSE